MAKETALSAIRRAARMHARHERAAELLVELTTGDGVH
jgi:hypothetical protein